jgi:hypothetical protein
MRQDQIIRTVHWYPLAGLPSDLSDKSDRSEKSGNPYSTACPLPTQNDKRLCPHESKETLVAYLTKDSAPLSPVWIARGGVA